MKPRDLPPAPVMNDGPAHDAGVEWWVRQFREAIAAGELECDRCHAKLMIEPQPDGRELMVCSARCGG